MTVRNPAWAMQGAGVLNPAERVRQFDASTYGWEPFQSFTGGIDPAHDGSHGVIRGYQVTANDTPNMSVNVSIGTAMVLGTEAGDQGSYFVANDATYNKSITASDPSLNRKDLICIQLNDIEYAGLDSNSDVVVVTGDPASVPVDPDLPTNCLVLARVNVDAGAGSIVLGDIDDLRTYASIMPVRCKSSKRPPNPEPGQFIYELDTDRVYVRNSANTIWYQVSTQGGYDLTAFFVGRTSNQSIGGSTVSQINSMSNVGVAGLAGPFNMASQVYPVGISGLYEFFTNWSMANFIGVPNRVLSLLYVDGLERYRDNNYTPGGDTFGNSTHWVTPLSVGNNVSFRILHDFGGVKDFSNLRFAGRIVTHY